jgi:hypothetical protein
MKRITSDHVFEIVAARLAAPPGIEGGASQAWVGRGAEAPRTK